MFGRKGTWTTAEVRSDAFLECDSRLSMNSMASAMTSWLHGYASVVTFDGLLASTL
jgi:hypothetical protein